jgi:hypothetical protein
MDHEAPHHHKHHREPDKHPEPRGRSLPLHPAWLYGLGFVLMLLVVLAWTMF